MLPKKILVVEDELIVKLSIKDIFLDFGISISDYVDTAENALNKLQKNSYDLIMMDINIKGSIDGIRLSKRIVKLYDVPIVFMTSYYDQDTIDEAMEVSPFGYITKPFTPTDIKLALTIAYQLFKKEDISKEDGIENHIVLINQDYSYSKVRNTLYYQNRPINLTRKHKLLLESLVTNINYTVNAKTLMYKIWGDYNIAESSLRTLVYSFRKKYPDIPIHNDSWNGYYLKTVV